MITDNESLLSALEGFLKSNNIKLRKSCASVSGPNVIMQLTPPMPRMSLSEMREALKVEVENYAILVGGDSVMDFQPLESDEDDASDSQRVLIGALQKEHSNAYSRLLTSAGIPPEFLENAPIASIRAFIDTEMFGDDEEQAVMLLIVDSENTYAVGIENGVIFFVHAIDFGSIWLYESEEHFVEFVREIQLCLNYCETDFRNIDFQRLILIADGDDNERVRNYIAENSTEIPTVELAYPFKNIAHIKVDESEADSYSLSAAIATGLAMRGAGMGHFLKECQRATHLFQINVNLLPFELIETKRFKLQLFKFSVCAILILGVLIGINSSVKSRLDALKTRMFTVEQEMKIIDQKSIGGVADVQKEIKTLKADIINYSVYLKTYQHTEWHNILKATSYLMPEDTWLTKVTIADSDTITFIGKSLSEESPFKLLDLIKMSEYFDPYDISIEQTKIMERNVVAFEIKCELAER